MFKSIFSILSKNSREEKPCIMLGDVKIVEKNGGKIMIDKTVILNGDPNGYHSGMSFPTTLLADVKGSKIIIRENTRIHGAYIHAQKSIEIGRGVLIAAGTNIIDSNGHTSEIKYARYRWCIHDEPKEIKIEDFVWIGLNVLILKGVKIGTCSIVAANSVVIDQVPPYSIVSGNPAKIIKQFSEGDVLPEGYAISELQKIKGYYQYI
jgi:acetyltransferase-like isoleucine patch superfamily enzyme